MARTSSPESAPPEALRPGAVEPAAAGPGSAAPPLPFVVRELDATRINRLVNLPEVHPHLALPGQGDLDLSAFAADPRNVLLMNEPGTVGVSFHWHADGIYEAHVAAAPKARGPACLAAVQVMVAFMFLSTDAVEIWTRVPVINAPADALARAVGGVLDFERPAAWPTANGAVAVRFYRLDFPTWARSAEILPRLGRWFHARLEAENARLGIPEDLHADDEAHDRHVGAGVGMILCGQVAKGVTLYNRLALVAGYGLITVPSLDPLVIDIGSHTLRIHPDQSNFEVLRCPQVQ